jgi:hypothetical protein
VPSKAPHLDAVRTLYGGATSSALEGITSAAHALVS